MKEENNIYGFNKNDFLNELDSSKVKSKEDEDKKRIKLEVDIEDDEEPEDDVPEVTESSKNDKKIKAKKVPLPYQKYIDDNKIAYEPFISLYDYDGELFLGCSKADTCTKKTCNGCDILKINFNRLMIFEQLAFSKPEDAPKQTDVYTVFIK